MFKKNKLISAISLTSLMLVSASSIAAAGDTTGTVIAKTIADVGIGVTSSVDFGDAIMAKSGFTCDIENTSLTFTDADGLGAGGDTTDNTLDAATWAVKSGSDCTTIVSGGEYAITGALGQTVNIKIEKPADSSQFTFNPTGKYIAKHVGGAAMTNADVTAAQASQKTIMSVPDLGSGIATAVVLDANGKGTLFVEAGLVLNVDDLSLDAPYSSTYRIEVIY